MSSFATARKKKTIAPSEAGAPMWEVFARRHAKDPLSHIGSVAAPNVRLAIARAWWTFDHFTWSEMHVAPGDSFVTVLERDEVRIGAV